MQFLCGQLTSSLLYTSLPITWLRGKPIFCHCLYHLLTLCRDTDNEEVDEDNPPQYDCSYLDRESPPVYTDALQDAVLAKGISIVNFLMTSILISVT